MKGKRRGKALLAALSLLLQLFLCAAPTVHAEGAPLRLTAQLSADGETVTVTLLTTEAVTLSNYDAQLAWDSAAFTLQTITNGQPQKLPNAQINTTVGSSGVGKISLISAGTDVTVGADETLAVFTLAVADAPDGGYEFTVTILDAADENGDALPWRDAVIRASLTVEPQQTALLAIRLSGRRADVDLVCQTENARLCCAVYTSGGRMAELHFQSATESGSQTLGFDLRDNSTGFVRIFLLDDAFRPLCASLTATRTVS